MAPLVDVTGDFAKLARLDAMARRAARKALVARAAAAIEPEVVRLARAGAAAGRDPYGAGWAPTSDGRGATLHAVLATLTATAKANVVRARVRHPGARIHQYGGVIEPKKKAGGRGGWRRGKTLAFTVGGAVVFARRVEMPRRQYMPESDRGLGPAWSEAFARATDAAVQAFFAEM